MFKYNSGLNLLVDLFFNNLMLILCHILTFFKLWTWTQNIWLRSRVDFFKFGSVNLWIYYNEICVNSVLLLSRPLIYTIHDLIVSVTSVLSEFNSING